MPTSARPDASAFRLALAGIALVTSWRLALLPFNTTDLFVDEAQYWFWGQELAWGYYSKPPLIGWLLRAVTELGGSTPFWIRLPLPLIHAGTAIVMAYLGRAMFGDRIGALAGFAYVSLPAVALASLMVSTDTPMLFFFALALLAHVQLARQPSFAWAVVLGMAIGLGLLSKYAMIYFPISAGLAVLLLPSMRITWRDALVAAIIALAICAPNLIWNAANDFTTLQHTADNADWEGSSLSPTKLAEFLAGQFAVAGPVFFAAYIAGLARTGTTPPLRYPALMSVPVFLIVSFQALVSGANANWAAAGHLGALLIAAVILAGRKRLLLLAFGINLAITAALPVMTVFADSWRFGSGNLVLARNIGQPDVSLWAGEMARAENLDTLVSGSRTFLADFFFTLRDSGLDIRAEPVEGFPPHHYAQQHPLQNGPGDVLYISRSSAVPDCPGSDQSPELVASLTPELGFFTRTISAYRMPRTCWFENADRGQDQ